MSEVDLRGKYVSPVARRVETITGHILVFKANEPLHVPPMCRPDMFAMGILPADGEVPAEMTPDEKQEVPEPIGQERIDKFNAAFTSLVETNDASDFTATGLPKLARVREITEMDVNSKELKDRWKDFNANSE